MSASRTRQQRIFRTLCADAPLSCKNSKQTLSLPVDLTTSCQLRFVYAAKWSLQCDVRQLRRETLFEEKDLTWQKARLKK
ncbi:hypothetical protein Enr17x_52700 [Gimesia fumaroli]|uniref:Uncharacterized protein n=1 Tax=Gimesia fumaroli TaxID=2527976 RepID=A0A518IJD7_9PLAN|nr:hypothetical protein Enr17x_52700 [Gimesia fumaroli]